MDGDGARDRRNPAVAAGMTATRLALLPARAVLDLSLAASRAQAGRALDRMLASPLPETVTQSLVEHRVAERVAQTALDERERTTAELDRLLPSPELERALERVLTSPALRAALVTERSTLAGELATGARRRAGAADEAVEGFARRVLRRPPRAAVADRPAPGGFVTRAVALLVDATVVALFLSAASGLAHLLAPLVGGVHRGWVVAALAAAAALALQIVYFVGCWSIAGQTPGMRLMGIRVVGPHGGEVGAGRAAVRLAGLLLALAPLGLGLLPALVDDRGRALQDFLAGTTVVQDEPDGGRT